LRSIAEDSFRFESASESKVRSFAKKERPVSWYSYGKTNADRWASAGFVASMLFLTITALYAFSLSNAAVPLFSEAAFLADRAAYDAGFRFRPEELVVTGRKITPQTALLEALKLPHQGSSLFYDAGTARARLLKLGWIETAEVRRVLPSGLEVAVTERIPFARWEDSGHRVQVIDAQGHLLGEDEDGRFQALPFFAGEGAPLGAAGFELALEGHKDTLRRIERAELIAERFWLVKLKSGLALKLPRKLTSLTLERLDSLLANPKIAGLSLEVIDLRLSNRTILQLLEPTVANRDKAIASLTSAPPQMLPLKKGKAS
jgi:cell division protein FtsQ